MQLWLMRGPASSPTWHFCYFGSSEPLMWVLPVCSRQGDRQDGRISIMSSPFSFPIHTGLKEAMKQLETLLTPRIPILSSQNMLKTWNLVSIYISNQISWFFQGSFWTDSCFVEKPWCKDHSPATFRKPSLWFQPRQRTNPISGKYKERERRTEAHSPLFISSHSI